MNTYETYAEQILLSLDRHRHMPPEPVSGAVRGEMAVLRLLSQETQGMNAGAIAAQLHMTTSRIAAVLNALEKKCLITRESDPADKRRIHITLTGKGIETTLIRRKEAHQHLTQLLMRLSPEDAASFARIMDQLLSSPCDSPSNKEV